MPPAALLADGDPLWPPRWSNLGDIFWWAFWGGVTLFLTVAHARQRRKGGE